MPERKKRRQRWEEDDIILPEEPLQQKEDRKEIAFRIARAVIAILGAAIGPTLLILIQNIVISVSGPNAVIAQQSAAFEVTALIVSALIFAALFYWMAPAIIRGFRYLFRLVEDWLNSIPMIDIVAGCAGLIVGLLIAVLLSQLLSQFPLPKGLIAAISTALYVLCGLLGANLATHRQGELRSEVANRKRKKNASAEEIDADRAKPKILDTSVIIDGRIFDICQTGIIEGRLIIPGFVLVELRHVSDSADGLKRERGRRGLDILNKIQNELDIPVEVDETDYEDVEEVDAKLLRMAQELDGTVLTNDFNLNKVAAVQGVPVLNINELANAIKPVVLPGEEMTVHVVKEGKEQGQGIGYLNDGTMIVVDGGIHHLNETLTVIVTSVLQTSAGRMIFAKL